MYIPDSIILCVIIICSMYGAYIGQRMINKHKRSILPGRKIPVSKIKSARAQHAKKHFSYPKVSNLSHEEEIEAAKKEMYGFTNKGGIE